MAGIKGLFQSLVTSVGPQLSCMLSFSSGGELARGSEINVVQPQGAALGFVRAQLGPFAVPACLCLF